MKARIAAIAFLLGTLTTGLCWLSLQPALMRLLESLRRLAAPESPEMRLVERVRELLPAWLVLALVATSLVAYVLLQLLLGRPLRETETLVERVGQSEDVLPSAAGGPLFTRLHRALAMTSRSLAEERARTREQMRTLKEANRRLASAQMELVSTERLATVGRLAAGVAHEVGNPLGGILG